MSVVIPAHWFQTCVGICMCLCVHMCMCVCVCVWTGVCVLMHLLLSENPFFLEMLLSLGSLQGTFPVSGSGNFHFLLCLDLFYPMWNVSLNLYKLNHWQ